MANQSERAATAPGRVLAMEGIHNFRDYGGYRAAGGRLKRGFLWRSGQHDGASAADLARVQALGLRTIVDLRGDSERAAAPCRRHPDFAGQVLFAPGETAGRAGYGAHEEAAMQVLSAADARAVMLRLYTGMAWRPVLVGTWQRYFAALAAGEGPVLLHCLAGKDRTGLAAALTHRLAGVHPDDAMADYLLTATAGNSAARIAAGAKHLRAAAGHRLDDAAIAVLMGVSPEFLDAAFAAIGERHGSIEAYAAAVLGIDAAQRELIARQLIE